MVKPWFRGVLFFFVTILWILIGCLGYKFFDLWKQRNQMKKISVTRLSKSNFLTQSLPTLHHYYEPIPNSSIQDMAVWMQSPVYHSINDDSLNSIRTYSVQKPPGVYRIIALGDSFTYGDHVNTQEAWPAQLEKLLQSSSECELSKTFEVLNLGVSGFDIQSEIERFRIRGQKYNPDLVLWLLIDNDFDEVREMTEGIAEEIYNQLKRQDRIDPYEPWVIPLLRSKVEFNKRYTKEQIHAFQNELIHNFNLLYKERLVYVSFPTLLKQYQEYIQTWVSYKKNSEYFDQLPDVEYNEQLHLLDHHPNAQGHLQIAKTLYRWLQDKKIISCVNE